MIITVKEVKQVKIQTLILASVSIYIGVSRSAHFVYVLYTNPRFYIHPQHFVNSYTA